MALAGNQERARRPSPSPPHTLQRRQMSSGMCRSHWAAETSETEVNGLISVARRLGSGCDAKESQFLA